MIFTIYAIAILLLALIGAFIVFRYKDQFWVYYCVLFSYAIISIASPFLLLGKGFIVASAWGFSIFGGGLILSSTYAFSAWKKFKVTSIFYGFIAIILLVVALDAFLIEPHTITVRHETLVSPKLTKPVRVLVLADIQTDNVGVYEKSVLLKAMAEKPDLIILCGDYIQTWPSRDPELCKQFRELLKVVKLSAPLGVYVVQGDVEWEPKWEEIFAGLPYVLFSETRTVEIPELAITGLTLYDSRNIISPPKLDKFHIIAGHAPDFSVIKPNGDLYIAGHTHGGQVQIPFFGPIMTGSIIDRKLAGGCFTKVNQNPEKYLMISRGIGMERVEAPRLRFLCLPEIVVIDLKPAK